MQGQLRCWKPSGPWRTIGPSPAPLSRLIVAASPATACWLMWSARIRREAWGFSSIYCGPWVFGLWKCCIRTACLPHLGQLSRSRRGASGFPGTPYSHIQQFGTGLFYAQLARADASAGPIAAMPLPRNQGKKAPWPGPGLDALVCAIIGLPTAGK